MTTPDGHLRAIPRRATYGTSPTQILKRDFFTNRHLTSFLRSSIQEHVKTGLAVLDFGCGEQPFRPVIESLGASYFSIDVVQNAGGNVDFVGRIEAYDPRGSRFDVILCSEVLEHVENPLTVINRLSTLLNENGVMIISTPFIHGLHEEPHDYVRLTTHFFRYAADENGLQVRNERRLGSNLEAAITVFNFFLYAVAPLNRTWKPFRVVATGLVNVIGLLLIKVPAFRNNRLMYLSNGFILENARRS